MILCLLPSLLWAGPPPSTVTLVPGSPDAPESEVPVPEPTVAEVLAAFEHEPPIGDVHRWASGHAQANPEQIDRWLRQATRFAALPQTTLEWRFTDGFDQRFDYLDINGDPLLPGADHAAVIDQASLDHAVTYRVRLDWELGDLVMSSERIRVIGEVQDLVQLRDEVLTEATRVYFERRRLQVEVSRATGRDVSLAVRDELRLLELTARLDALTGGRFSAALGRTPTRK